MPSLRVRDLDLDFITEAEFLGAAASVQTLIDAVGATGDILAIPNSGSAYFQRQAIWGTLEAEIRGKQRFVNGYTIRLKIEERK
jgi:hypothetical protein